MPAIPAAWEAEARGLRSQAQPEQLRPCLNKIKRIVRLAQQWSICLVCAMPRFNPQHCRVSKVQGFHERSIVHGKFISAILEGGKS